MVDRSNCLEFIIGTCQEVYWLQFHGGQFHSVGLMLKIVIDLEHRWAVAFAYSFLDYEVFQDDLGGYCCHAVNIGL